MIFIGIDPGKQGGIAAVFQDGSLYFAEKMPETERDLLAICHRVYKHSEESGYRAVLELVRATPQMGVVSAFTFGKGYGAIRMALIAAGIPFDEVTPPVWQRVMQCRTHGDKTISKRRAQELFPALTMSHAIADALLLAEYARRTEHARGTEDTFETQGSQRPVNESRARRPRHRETTSAAPAVARGDRPGAIRPHAPQPTRADAARSGGHAHPGAR